MRIRRFVTFHNRHPRELGAEEVRAFLDTLTRERRVSASVRDARSGFVGNRLPLP